MMGPFSVMLITTKIESTTVKTEQKDKQNWQGCLQMSLHDCLTKKRSFPQQVSLLP